MVLLVRIELTTSPLPRDSVLTILLILNGALHEQF